MAVRVWPLIDEATFTVLRIAAVYALHSGLVILSRSRCHSRALHAHSTAKRISGTPDLARSDGSALTMTRAAQEAVT